MHNFRNHLRRGSKAQFSTLYFMVTSFPPSGEFFIPSQVFYLFSFLCIQHNAIWNKYKVSYQFLFLVEFFPEHSLCSFLDCFPLGLIFALSLGGFPSSPSCVGITLDPWGWLILTDSLSLNSPLQDMYLNHFQAHRVD